MHEQEWPGGAGQASSERGQAGPGGNLAEKTFSSLTLSLDSPLFLQEGLPFGDLCPPGHFCPAGTKNPRQRPCPVGTWNAERGASDVSWCLPCPPGLFCAEAGQAAPRGPCASGEGDFDRWREGTKQRGAGQPPQSWWTESREICPCGWVCATGATLKHRTLGDTNAKNWAAAPKVDWPEHFLCLQDFIVQEGHRPQDLLVGLGETSAWRTTSALKAC